MSRPQAKSHGKNAASAAAASHHRHHHHGKARHGGHWRPPPRWPSRVMHGLRRMLAGFFSFPPRPPTVTFSVDSGGGGGGDVVQHHVPKRSSCSSTNLQPVDAHYDEAIADCVEFFHRSAPTADDDDDVRPRPPPPPPPR